jgi:hypothetical protein
MGHLKGRFSSLRGLRQQIDDSVDHKRAITWVKACIVIHNLISFIEEGEEDLEYEGELIREGMEGEREANEWQDIGEEVPGERDTPGHRKRREMKAALLDSLE